MIRMTDVTYWKCEDCDKEIPKTEAVERGSSWIRTTSNSEFCVRVADSRYDSDHTSQVVIRLWGGEHFCSVKCLVNYIRRKFREWEEKKKKKDSKE